MVGTVTTWPRLVVRGWKSPPDTAKMGPKPGPTWVATPVARFTVYSLAGPAFSEA